MTDTPQISTTTPPTAPQTRPFLAAVLALLIGVPTLAQPQLAEEPLRLDQPGLLLRLPVDATAQTRTLAGREATTIALPSGLGTVVLQARELSPTDTATPTPDAEAAELVARILGLDRPFNPDRSRRSTQSGRALDPGPRLASPAGPIRPLYAEAIRPNGSRVFRGVAVAQPSPNRRVVFDLIAPAARTDDARRTFEAVLATVTPRNANAAVRTDEARRRTAAALLAGISDERLAALVDEVQPRFERLYRPPGPNGGIADERGYRRTTARLGQRGDITGTPESRRTAAEREPGYVVTIDARLLGTAGERIDSRATYFLGQDRRTETWTITMSVRSEGPTAVWTETGARTGRDLTVSIARGTTGRRTIRPDIRVEGFLSRVEAILLPKLLAAAGEPGAYAFTAYDSQLETVQARTETLERTTSGWSLVTAFEDGRAQTSTLSPTGSPLRTDLDSGLVWEATTFDRLYDLWSRKGLPLD